MSKKTSARYPVSLTYRRHLLCNLLVLLVLPASHTPTIIAFTPQLQGVIAPLLLLIASTHEGMARLSWPGWLICWSCWRRLDAYLKRTHKWSFSEDIVTLLFSF